MKGKLAKRGKKPADRSVLEMSATAARKFFLKPVSYCRVDLPPYFDFRPVLRDVEKVLAAKPLNSLNLKPRDHEGVNYTIYSNKDGRYAWRPFQLVHPAIYVDLVSLLTAPSAWTEILARFNEFSKNPRIKCLSIPRESRTARRDQAAQILHWWQGIEQASIELALDFSYVFHADVTDCYASIYTHSVAWAMHGKSVAKAKKHDKSLLGNQIDKRLQDMQQGQTNGIPQGSVLLDLLAELVLGCADVEVSDCLDKAGIQDFRVLRYRDDYRVFVNDSHDGEVILKVLSEVLMGLGLKLNTSKTTNALAVVSSSVKRDKLAWLRGSQTDENLQKHLLLIHAHGAAYPNGGSLIGALDVFYKRLTPLRTVQNPLPMISMAIDIGANSPRCFPACAAIVSKLLSVLGAKKDKVATVEKVRHRLQQVPNNGHLEVWLQRISYPVEPSIEYDECLCRLVTGDAVKLWNNSWIKDAGLEAAVDATRVVSKKHLREIRPVVPRVEFTVFAPY